MRHVHHLRGVVVLASAAVQDVDLTNEYEIDSMRRVALVEDKVLSLFHLDVQTSDQFIQLRVGELSNVLEVEVDH